MIWHSACASFDDLIECVIVFFFSIFYKKSLHCITVKCMAFSSLSLHLFVGSLWGYDRRIIVVPGACWVTVRSTVLRRNGESTVVRRRCFPFSNLNFQFYPFFCLPGLPGPLNLSMQCLLILEARLPCIDSFCTWAGVPLIQFARSPPWERLPFLVCTASP